LDRPYHRGSNPNFILAALYLIRFRRPSRFAQGTKERSAFTRWLCRELTGACRREAPPLPKDRKKGPPFKTADPQDLELNKMMANMKARALQRSRGQLPEALRSGRAGSTGQAAPIPARQCRV